MHPRDRSTPAGIWRFARAEHIAFATRLARLPWGELRKKGMEIGKKPWAIVNPESNPPGGAGAASRAYNGAMSWE